MIMDSMIGEGKRSEQGEKERKEARAKEASPRTYPPDKIT